MIFSHTKFLWNEHTKSFSADASALAIQSGLMPREIQLLNSDTGVVRLFIMTYVGLDDEGDVGYWEYTDASVSHTTMVIFND